ncbi:ABC transporter substrate-binding protein [Actinophytocola sp.]|uniref:ABC transporter substrate-binding protein n=1 Tax=Actinophytocola sp. TaxID=1872138 RepID=UPI003D6BABD8
MKMRKATAVLLGTATTLSLSACGAGGGTGGGGAGGEAPYIAIVSKGFQHEFWQAVKRGAEDEAAKAGARVTFVGPPTEADVEEQINMLTNDIAKNPQAIGFAALDSRAAEPLLAQARSQNIPVIAFDSGVDSDVPVTTVATDNKAAAAEAAKHMAELVGGKGEVAMVVHDQTSKSGTDRRDGFMDWMKENAPGITVLSPQYGGGDQAESANITKSIISANPDLAGIYASNEGSAIGVIKGVEESGRSGIQLVGFDSGKAQIDAIKDGTMAGAVTQDPLNMGRELVRAAMKAINGENQPKNVDTGFYWYDRTNVDDDKIRSVLYE